jgi:hypothetical protein
MGKPLLSLVFAVALVLVGAPAVAQEPTPEPEGESMTPAPTEEAAPAEEGAPAEPEAEVEPAMKERSVRWGVGGRIRYVFMPKAVLNLFVDQSQSMTSVGFGLQGIRRKGDFDIVFGFEYENIAADTGYWTESGGDPSMGDTDYVTFDGFGLLGLDIGFIWHQKIAEFGAAGRVDFRYGAGIGIGFLLGDYIQTDAVCSVTRVDQVNDTTCPPSMRGASVTNDSKPPVVPIVNVLVGSRVKVTDEIAINVELGFRDVFFFGVGSDYVF